MLMEQEKEGLSFNFKKKLKILFISHEFNNYSNGEIKFIYNLALHFLEKGNEVHLLGFGADPEIIEKKAEFHRIKRIIERPHFLKSLIFLIFSTIFVLRNRKKFDLIHASGPNVFAYHHINTCQFVHSAYKRYLKFFKFPLIKKIYYYFFHNFFSFLEKLIYKKSKIIIAVSEKIKKELINFAKVNPSKIEIIYNGINPSEFPFKSEKEKEELLKEYPFLKNKTIFLFAGDITTNRKGVEFLIKAFKDLNEKAFLLIIGNEKNSPYPYLVKKLNLENKIKFLGFKKDISFYYRASDFFIFPSLYDPCPIVVFEAMKSLSPCIVSDKKFCGSAEIIENEKEGFIIKNPFNTYEIKEKILKAIKNKEKIKEMEKNIKEKIKMVYFENIFKKYEEIYYKLLS